MRAAEEWEALCPLGPQERDAAGTGGHFTAGFLQRHQIPGRSSHAQPASLVTSPVQEEEPLTWQAWKAASPTIREEEGSETETETKRSAEQCCAGQAESRAAE